MRITTVDPATGRPLATYDTHGDVEVDELLDLADEATRAWGATELAGRSEVLRRLAAVLRDEAESLAGLVTAEMGKPLAESRAEVEKCVVTLEHFAEHAAAMLSPEPVDMGAGGPRAHVAYEPLGLVLAIMPWNFPLWQVVRFAAPALAAGNGVLLKHAPNVTGSALALQDLAAKAGLPPNVFTTLVLEDARVATVSERLLADRRIAAVTLTGSNRAGAAVGATAGREVKKAVLELGGSDAFVVLADADVSAAAAAAVRARFQNAGQSCVCAKRFVVEEPVYDEFVEALLAGVGALVVGDPRDPATSVGPMARADLRDELHRQVQDSVAAGADLLLGGAPAPGDGFGYLPTVLAARPGMRVFDEETFGPVAALVRADDAADAMRLAAATEYGLGLSIWSSDTDRAQRLAATVPTGMVFVNAVVASDPRIPFGGVRRSGFGRELSSHGLREFVNTRTYWVAGAPG